MPHIQNSLSWVSKEQLEQLKIEVLPKNIQQNNSSTKDMRN